MVFTIAHVDTRAPFHESDTKIDFAGKADALMTRTTLSLAFVALLAACGDGQPLFDEEVASGAEGIESGVPDIEGTPFEELDAGSDPDSDNITDPDDILANGTVSPPLNGARANRGDIVRAEARSGSGGITSLFNYNGTDDTFNVDGLAFDGLNTYQRFATLPQLGETAVYRADATVADALTENLVEQQAPYFALYDTSDTALDDGTLRTSFAIVRTGAYSGFGFGSYAYQRAGTTTLPETGQATFSGTYAGARVFDIIAGLELTQGDVTIDIDFDDFNGTPGIKGLLSNRRMFDEFGNELETFNEVDRGIRPSTAVQTPNLPFVVRASGETISSNGELVGEIRNRIRDPATGAFVTYEDGNYYGILAGDLTDPADGGEIVGVLVFEVEDSRYANVNAQETGGFIATR
ncbi:MAG: hypothetical protein ACI9ND_001349 [Yoonia sp.]